MIIIKELQKDVNQMGKSQKTHLISRAYYLKEVTKTHKYTNININNRTKMNASAISEKKPDEKIH